jgi:hypothetical protein
MTLLFVISSLFYSSLVVTLFGPLESFIRLNFFPSLQEAEIYTYLIILGMYVVWMTVVTKVADNIHISPPNVWKKPIQYLSLGTLIIGSSCGMYYFISRILSDSQFQFHLWEMGLWSVNQSAAYEVYISISVCLIALILLFIPVSFSKSLSTVCHIAAIGVIMWLTLGMNALNLFDYTHYSGPINDVLMGQPLLTFRSWYGFLSIFSLSVLFRIIPLTLMNLHLVFSAIQCVGFILFYILCNIIFKDIRWAIVTTIYAIFANHLVKIGATYEFPQQTFWRMGMWLPLAFAVYWSEKNRSATKKYIEYLPVLVMTIIFYWTLDFGMYAILAFFMYSWLSSSVTTLSGTWKHVATIGLRTMLCLAIVFIGLSVFYKFAYGFFPMWLTYFFTMFTYSSEYLLHLPPYQSYWTMFVIPVLTIGILLSLKKHRALSPAQSTVSYIACVGLLSFTYFIGESHINALHALCLPFIICLFYLLKFILDSLQHSPFTLKAGSIYVLALALSIPSMYLAKQGIYNLRYINPISTVTLIQSPKTDEFSTFGPTVSNIRNKYSDVLQDKQFAILSIWDSWYLPMLHATNTIGSNCLSCYYVNESGSNFVEKIRQSDTTYLFVDTDMTQRNNRVASIFQPIANTYTYIETLGLLDVYKKINQSSSHD